MAGKLLQVQHVQAAQSSTTAVIPADDTIPQNTEGLEIMSISFTPLSATSKLDIEIGSGSFGACNLIATLALFVDSTVDAIASHSWNEFSTIYIGRGEFRAEIDSTNTTTRTYKVRLGTSTGTLSNYRSTTTLGGMYVPSWMKISEVEV